MLRSSDSVLARFTRDLTAEARFGRLEPVRCRGEEISRVIDILLRHGKNNPALVGPAGVGKTAIAEGLAQRVARGDVPLSLRGVRILAVDHVSLLAGTAYRGQYEERIKGLVEETSAQEDAILFVDELHNLIGQGTAIGVAMDAANMLKPALVRGDFRVIGATTDDEYERWVCGDPALERRFQKVAVRQLSSEETLEILKARKLRLERHHNVVIADEALDAAVQLTDAHMTDRVRPDRAIDALDEACAHAHAVADYPESVERLVLERRALVRARESRSRDQRQRDTQRAHEEAESRQAEEKPRIAREQADDLPPPGEEGDDSIDRFARDGLAALERFGAELEAMFSAGASASEPLRRPSSPSSSEAMPEPTAPRQPEPSRLSALDLELARQLAEAGIVVRGHDVARVVALSSGQTVRWKGE